MCTTTVLQDVIQILRVTEWGVKLRGQTLLFKVALGIFFALIHGKSNLLLLFTYLITLGKDVTFPLITKFKQVSELSICKPNTELKYGLTD